MGRRLNDAIGYPEPSPGAGSRTAAKRGNLDGCERRCQTSSRGSLQPYGAASPSASRCATWSAGSASSAGERRSTATSARSWPRRASARRPSSRLRFSTATSSSLPSARCCPASCRPRRAPRPRRTRESSPTRLPCFDRRSRRSTACRDASARVWTRSSAWSPTSCSRSSPGCARPVPACTPSVFDPAFVRSCRTAATLGSRSRSARGSTARANSPGSSLPAPPCSGPRLPSARSHRGYRTRSSLCGTRASTPGSCRRAGIGRQSPGSKPSRTSSSARWSRCSTSTCSPSAAPTPEIVKRIATTCASCGISRHFALRSVETSAKLVTRWAYLDVPGANPLRLAPGVFCQEDAETEEVRLFFARTLALDGGQKLRLLAIQGPRELKERLPP